MPRFEIKICGLTNLDDALAAVELGADYIGFVTYAKSPRSVTPATITTILSAIRVPFKAVGVFVNEPRSSVENIAEDCGLYAVQLHGDETPGDFPSMRVPVWRAVRLTERKEVPSISGWHAERYVIDAAPAGVYGGAGVAADWQHARKIAERHPVMLAGGLTPANVSNALLEVHPLGVDVSSGLESSPGKKDIVAMERFVRAVRQAETV